jgi:Trypsin/PEP-CTERM motif
MRRALFGLVTFLLFAPSAALADTLPLVNADHPDLRINPLITTQAAPDSPAAHVYTPGAVVGVGGATGTLDGVAVLLMQFASGGGAGCSGTLVANSFIVTAAHCIADDFGAFDIESLTATFNLPGGGTQTLNGAEFWVNPGFTGFGSADVGDDIAVVRLDGVANAALQRYGLHTGPAIVQNALIAGYGLPGTGLTGAQGGFPAFGTLRFGQNTVEFVWNEDGLPYGYDFDNYTAACNTALAALGVGSNQGVVPNTSPNNEVMIAPGDSGGPMFFAQGGALVLGGVHSFGVTFINQFGACVGSNLNSGFGTFGGDTRVNAYLDFINGAVNGTTPGVSPIPEPATMVLLGSGLAALAARRRRNRS